MPISGENFPQYTYSQLNKLLNDKNKKVIISFNEIEHKEKNGDDLFDIKAYIITEEELNNIINNPKKEISGNEIKGKYNLNDKKGIIDLSSQKIEDHNYVYIIISKNSENKNTYKKLKIDYKAGEKDDDGNKKNEKDGKGWIVILIILIIVCIILVIALLIFKKKRLENYQKTEKEVNNMNMPLNE